MNTQEEVWILKREVAELKTELNKFKNVNKLSNIQRYFSLLIQFRMITNIS